MKDNELISLVSKLPLLAKTDEIAYEDQYFQTLEPKKGHIYNFRTGEIEKNRWNKEMQRVYIYNAFRSTDVIYNAITMRYIDTLNIVAIYKLDFDTTPFNLGDKREFVASDVIYITKDKKFIYKKDGAWKCEVDQRTLSIDLPFSLKLDCLNEEFCMGELTKLYGIIKKDGWYNVIDNVSSLIKFLFSDIISETEKTTKKLKALSEKTLKHKLDECTDSFVNCNTYGSKTTGRVAQLYYVNDEISVIRWFKHVMGKNYEYMRFYLTDEGNFLCDIGNDGEFHALTKFINKDEMRCDMFIMDKAKLKDSKFKYFFDMIEEFNVSDRAINLYETFRFDLIEKLSKTGLPNLVKCGLTGYHRSRLLPYTTIGKACSVKINPKETDIYRGLGLNKHQYKTVAPYLDSFSTYYTVDSFVFQNLRNVLKKSPTAPLNDIDNKTFDKFFELFKTLAKSGYYSHYVNSIVDQAKDIYSLDAIYSTLEIVKKLMSSRYTNQLVQIRDYINMVKRMDDAKSFPLKFKDTKDMKELAEDIKEKHDAACVIYNYIAQKANEKTFKKQAEKCKKWEFTLNGLSVVSPTHPGDLAKEGLELHHCVKSYIDKVIDGKTNIVFIRKADEIDKPFFTVEVSNSGTIEQVHGFSNRNANTEPGLEEFINEWAKDKKLKVTGYNKVR